MFDKKRKFFEETFCLKRFLFVFTLRQGTILIAVHQIALSALFLILLLTGLSNVGTMMSLLHADMEDDAETREYYRKILQGEDSIFANGEPIHSLNDKMFNVAENLASEIVILLYSTTILTAIYLAICISLLHGAIKYRRKLMVPWIVASVIGLIITAILFCIGGTLKDIIKFYGGHKFYYLFCLTSLAMSTYAILTVSSFVAQVDKLRPDVCGSVTSHERNVLKPRPRSNRQQKYELGERMVLIDHAAQSSVLSTTQLNKLSSGMQSHFV